MIPPRRHRLCDQISTFTLFGTHLTTHNSAAYSSQLDSNFPVLRITPYLRHCDWGPLRNSLMVAVMLKHCFDFLSSQLGGLLWSIISYIYRVLFPKENRLAY